MPTYEYECKRCHKTFERFQKISERPLQKCPHCKGSVRRLIGRGAGLIFKGSGFYATDYRSQSYKAAAKKETEGKAGPEGTKAPLSEPKKQSETKPAG